MAMDAWLNSGDVVTEVVGGDGVVDMPGGRGSVETGTGLDDGNGLGVTVRGAGAGPFPPTEQADARTRLSPTTVLAVPPDLLNSRSPRISSI
jgi:hypothetical protein